MTEIELKSISEMLVKKLRIGRERGIITPANPINGKTLADDYNRKFGAQLTDADIREVVNYARGEMGAPIGSSVDGYWWCVTQTEWEETKARLLHRIKKQQRAAFGPDRYWMKLNDRQLFSDTEHQGQPLKVENEKSTS